MGGIVVILALFKPHTNRNCPVNTMWTTCWIRNRCRNQRETLNWENSSGSRGPASDLPPRIFFKSCSFQTILREKTPVGAHPTLGVKTPLGPHQDTGSTHGKADSNCAARTVRVWDVQCRESGRQIAPVYLPRTAAETTDAGLSGRVVSAAAMLTHVTPSRDPWELLTTCEVQFIQVGPV